MIGKPTKSASFALLLLLFISATPVRAGGGDPGVDMKEMMEDMGRSMPEECFTPPDLEERFLNACRIAIEDSDKCPAAWEAFTDAFAFKNPNNVTGDDYKSYFDVLPISSTPNSVVFWSGVQGVIEQISRYPNISSSANQDASNVINTMTADGVVECWCGNKTAILDTVNPCPMTATTVFWQEFSCLLAESTTGIAYWVGYGDREGGAYQSSSFFANYEFPKLISDRVKRLAIVNIHDHDCGNETEIIGDHEDCGEGTLRTLQRQAERKYGRSMGAECYEVCGNPFDEKQVLFVANETLGIIREEQRGKCAFIYVASYMTH